MASNMTQLEEKKNYAAHVAWFYISDDWLKGILIVDARCQARATSIAAPWKSVIQWYTSAVWVFPKIGVVYTPKWMVYNGKPMKTLLKWMIWGCFHPYFWKHPYGCTLLCSATPISSECPRLWHCCSIHKFKERTWRHVVTQQVPLNCKD